ncbi:MAG: phosphatidate cytidylyltransferase [Phycisphaerales bacterium]
MLRQRLLLGPVLIALVLAGVWLDEWLDVQAPPTWLAELIGRQTFPPGVIVFIVVLVLALLAGRELARLLRGVGIEASTGVTCVLAALGVCVTSLVPANAGESGVLSGMAVANGVTVLALLGSLAVYARRQRPKGMIAAAGGALLAYVYIGVLLGFMCALRREHSAWVLVWVLLTTKASDIGAYFTGRAIGRHKLALWLSPGKTWEGLVGGMALAAAVGGAGAEALADIVPKGSEIPSWWAGAIAGGVFAVMGQLGDLVASVLKRDAGVKDSGTSLPGFGGVLDVIDSPMVVGVAAFWWLRTGIGVVIAS